MALASFVSIRKRKPHQEENVKQKLEAVSAVPYPTSEETLEKLTATLYDAFGDEPIFAFAFRCIGGYHERKDIAENIFRAAIRVTSMQGFLFHSGDHGSCTLWYPPGVDMLSNLWKTGVWKDMLRVPMRVNSRFINHGQQSDKEKAKFFKDKQHKKPYYLFIAGTCKAKQGQGLLKHNMWPMLHQADREGKYCYLETATQKNVSLYQRYGFQVIGGFQLVDKIGKTHVWCMAREPGASRD